MINLAAVWGLGQERGVEAVGSEARNVVLQAQMRRRGFKGIIDIIYGGEKPETTFEKEPAGEKAVSNGKRKAEVLEAALENSEAADKPLSKRAQKRQAKRARANRENVEETQQ